MITNRTWIDKPLLSWYILYMQDWSDKRWQLGKKSLPVLGDCFHMLYLRRNEDHDVPTKVLVDPFRDAALSERVVLCLNALVGVSSERLKSLLASADTTSNDVIAIIAEAAAKPRKKVAQLRVRAVKK